MRRSGCSRRSAGQTAPPPSGWQGPPPAHYRAAAARVPDTPGGPRDRALLPHGALRQGCRPVVASGRPDRRRARHRQVPPRDRALGSSSGTRRCGRSGARGAVCRTARACPSGLSARSSRRTPAILETDDLETVQAKLGAVVPEGPDREWLRNRLRALLGLEAPPASREENSTAWLRLLEELACAGPAVVVIEDLHWADEALLAFIEYVAGNVADVPLLVIVTARPELFERQPSFAAAIGRVNRLVLDPLSAVETERSGRGSARDGTRPWRGTRHRRGAVRGQPLLRRGVGAPASRSGGRRGCAGARRRRRRAYHGQTKGRRCRARSRP